MRLGAVAVAFLAAAGAACGPDTDSDTSVIDRQDPLTSVNGISSNGISSNGISSNGLVLSALVSHAITTTALANNPSVLNALKDTGAQGNQTRMFFRYLVSCALPATASVSYSWRDGAGVPHTEINPGGLALATSWASGAVDSTGRQLVSACLAARTNALGVNVPISLRGNGAPSLQATAQERLDFPFGEGAFWGDLFSSSPWLRSCGRSPFNQGSATSQYLAQGRSCATSTGCGIIKYVGPCYTRDYASDRQACFARDHVNNDWMSECTSFMNIDYQSNTPVITTWLKP